MNHHRAAMPYTEAEHNTESFLVGGGVPQCLQPALVKSRRQFLATAGAAVAGVVIGAPRVQAALFNPRPVPGIPHAWVQAKGSDVLRYASFIQSLRLRNITPHMLLAPHFKTRGRMRNTLPPKSQWKSIAATLRVADRMVVSIGAPLREITSAYRSPRYNRAVGGKSRSYHMRNMALDLQFKGVSASHVYYAARRLRSKGVFKGGIGRYPTFTHIDTRGTNVSW